MPEELIVRSCAPTLAGLKSANLFSVEYTSREALGQELRRLNNILVPKGLRALPLSYGKKRAQIYLYRPQHLKADLSNEAAQEILRQLGYELSCPEACLRQLQTRMNTQEEFPHEIGLFLSYPPEDVQGFMENKARGHKCVGCWKVYGDVDAAKERFCAYKRCTAEYCSRLKNGTSIAQLATAV